MRHAEYGGMKPVNCLRHLGHRRIRLILGNLLLALALTWAGRAVAGDESSTLSAAKGGGPYTNAYLSVGVGGASNVGPMAMLTLSVDFASYLFLARGSSASDFAILSPPKSAIQDYSALVGKVWRSENTRAYAAVGLGLASITRRGNEINPGETLFPSYEMLYDDVINVPVQVGVSADCGFAGIGLALVGNVNSVLSDLGLVLTVSLGKMHE